MALLISGTTVVTDNSNGIFTTVTVPSTGFIEIPDNSNTTFGTLSYRTRACTPVQFADASWSWWQKPVALREKTATKDITYVGFTSRNGSVSIAVTNNKTMQTNSYMIGGPELFSILDDHNSGVVYAGNGNVVVFFQGRCLNVAGGVRINNSTSAANANNMFFVVFDANNVNSPASISGYNNTIIQNTSFTFEWVRPSGTPGSSFYPNILVSNNKFLLLGRQSSNSGGGDAGINNWNYITSNYPLPGNTITQPNGFFKSAQTWPYFAISRSGEDKDKFVYALGWHPISSNFKERHVYYGYLTRNAANVGEAWDVYKPEPNGFDTKVGCLVNSGWTPMQVANLELAVVNMANGSQAITSFTSTPTVGENGYMRIRLLDVSDNRIAYGVFANNYVTTFNPTTSGNTVYKVNIANAFITTSTTSLAISGGAKTLTVSSGSIYIGGQPVTVRYDSSNYMKGYVTAYNLTSRSLSFTATASYGSGTYSSWVVDGTSNDDDYYTSWVLRSSNTFLPNVATIIDYDATTKLATLQTPLNVAVTGTDTVTLSGNNVYQYHVAYKLYSANDIYEWFSKRLCTGGRDFTGGVPANYVSGTLDQRQYAGGMTFNYRSNTDITVCREVANTWYVEEVRLNNVSYMMNTNTEIYDPETLTTTLGYQSIGYTTLSSFNSANINPGFIVQRPFNEMLSEDTMINDPNANTRGIVLTGYFNKRDFEDSTSNAISTKASDFTGNTLASSKSTLNNFNVSSYIELTSPTTVFGFASGGLYSSIGTSLEPGVGTNIDRFPLASDVNATDFGDLTTRQYGGGGASSTTHGYASGGQIPAAPTSGSYSGIQKFSFAAGISAILSGNLSEQRRFSAGQSSSTHGYHSGGINSPSPTALVDTVDKYPFSADADATDVGNLTQARSTSGGISSSTNGYTTGGTVPAPLGTSSNVIDKFPFASDANATDVGDLVTARRNVTNASDISGGYGYTSGGFGPPSPSTNNIDIERFPFASDTNASDVGNLSTNKRWGAGISSSTHGYNAGGDSGNPVLAFTFLASTDKFPFASSTSGTNVLNLSVARFGTQGHQG